MRILITGGNGQLGRALQTAFTSDEVEAFGHSDLDITNREQVSRTISRHQPDFVIHAAAWTDTAGCERDPDLAMRVNGEGAAIVAEACREAGSAMLYISSNEVFDGEKPTPYVEDDQPNPDQRLRPIEARRRATRAGSARSVLHRAHCHGCTAPGARAFRRRFWVRRAEAVP